MTTLPYNISLINVVVFWVCIWQLLLTIYLRDLLQIPTALYTEANRERGSRGCRHPPSLPSLNHALTHSHLSNYWSDTRIRATIVPQMSISTNWLVLFCCFSSVTYLSGCEFWGLYELMVFFKEDSYELGGGTGGQSLLLLVPRSPSSRTLVPLCLPTPTLHCVAPVFKIKKIALKSEPLRTLQRAHWSGIPLKQVCKFCRKQGSQQRPSLFSRQIFLTVGRLVSGTVTHGCSGEQNGGHWCSNYGLYFFQILVLYKILWAAFRDTLYFSC